MKFLSKNLCKNSLFLDWAVLVTIKTVKCIQHFMWQVGKANRFRDRQNKKTNFLLLSDSQGYRIVKNKNDITVYPTADVSR